MVNDINGFRAQGALRALKESDAALCIMHMQGTPQTMQAAPHYEDVLKDVKAFLHERINAAMREGIDARRLCVDPGFGFGKTLEHNLTLMKNLNGLMSNTGFPVLAGVSRKGMIGQLTGRAIDQRVAGSVAAALAAIANGASIVRVHDVAETVDAIKVWRATRPLPGG
jgi:dihydropteroate synthase